MRRLAAVVVAVLFGVVMPGLATSVHADVAGSNEEDILVQIDVGENPLTRAREIAEDIGANTEGLHCPDPTASPDDVAARTPTPPLMYCFTNTPGYNGFWLQLTTTQANRYNDLYGPMPPWMRGTGRAYDVTVPMLPESVIPEQHQVGPRSGLPINWADQSGQWIDPGLLRMQWRAPDDDLANIGHRVAIADTGTDGSHPDLNVTGGFDCTFEFADRWFYDPHGHGTFTGGQVGAYNNGRGTVGGVPGVALDSLVALGSQGYGTSASVACTVDAAIARGDSAINFSLGGVSPPSFVGGQDPYHNLFAAASEHIIIVTSAGNSADDAINHAPANYTGVITVGAIASYHGGFSEGQCAADIDDNSFAWFSSYGDVVDYVAPGVCSTSTIPGGRRGSGSGTSFSAPKITAIHVDYLIRHNLSRQPKDLTQARKRVRRWSQIWMTCDTPAASCVALGQYNGYTPGDIGRPPPPLGRFGG